MTVKERLDKLLGEEDYVAFYSVKDGVLSRIILNRYTVYSSFPVAAIAKDITDNFVKTFINDTRDIREMIENGECYREDFVDVDKIDYYVAVKDEMSLSELKNQAISLSTDYPFARTTPSVTGCLARKVTKKLLDAPYLTQDVVNDIVVLGVYEEYPRELEALKEELSKHQENLLSVTELLEREAADTSVVKVPFKASASDPLILWEKLGRRLPGMNDIANTIRKGVDWGVRYDANNEILYPTLNGERYTKPQKIYSAVKYDGSVKISPANLSIMLSGIVPLYASKEPIFRFLLRPENKPYADSLRASLPNAQRVFDEAVEECLSSHIDTGEWKIVTTGDCPHGIYLGNSGFIPLQEFMSEQSVLHICEFGAPNSLDGTFSYYAYAELIRDNKSYIYQEGQEGWSEPESDNDRIVEYPSIVTKLKIKDDKIVNTVLFEDKGPGRVAKSPDTPNSQMDVSSSVSTSVMAAAVFTWRDRLRELSMV